MLGHVGAPVVVACGINFEVKSVSTSMQCVFNVTVQFFIVVLGTGIAGIGARLEP